MTLPSYSLSDVKTQKSTLVSVPGVVECPAACESCPKYDPKSIPRLVSFVSCAGVLGTKVTSVRIVNLSDSVWSSSLWALSLTDLGT